MDRVSGDFVRGYTKAIRDVTRELECVNAQLIDHRMRMNYSWVKKTLDYFLKNRAYFREDYENWYFIRLKRGETGKWDELEVFRSIDAPELAELKDGK